MPTKHYRFTLAPRGIAAFALLTLPLGSGVSAQGTMTEAELLDHLRERVDRAGAGAIAAGVIERTGNRVIAMAGETGNGTSLTTESVFEIGSITKAFTGILLAGMANEGLVSLDDPVASLLPDGVTVPTRGGRQIRLLDLSTHRSGLPRLPTNLRPANMANPYADYTAEKLYEFLGAYTLPRDIGAEYEYSNLGAGLLGHALSLRAGASYEQLVRDRILQPLGMSDTGITLTPAARERKVEGHGANGAVVPGWDLQALAGAGALRSTLTDMLTFARAQLDPPSNATGRAIRTSHEARAPLANARDSIALGWHIVHVGEARIHWHNGGTGGFHTMIAFDLERAIAAVVLANSQHDIDDIALHLIDERVPLAPPPVERPEPGSVQVDRDVMERGHVKRPHGTANPVRNEVS